MLVLPSIDSLQRITLRRAKRYGRIRAGLNYFLYVQVMRLSPAEAEYALRNDPKITEYDHEEGEDRWKATFSTAALRVLFLILLCATTEYD